MKRKFVHRGLRNRVNIVSASNTDISAQLPFGGVLSSLYLLFEGICLFRYNSVRLHTEMIYNAAPAINAKLLPIKLPHPPPAIVFVSPQQSQTNPRHANLLAKPA